MRDYENKLIMVSNEWKQRVFEVTNDEFAQLAIQIFYYQAIHNKVYKEYLKLIGNRGQGVDSLSKIPFLPIDLFKTHYVTTGEAKPEIVFSSSGTTGLQQSKHLVSDVTVYEQSFLNGFEYFYGSPSKYCILALLPSYQEREGSSLIYMVRKLIEESKHPLSGFFLNEDDELIKRLNTLETQKQSTILIGVSFALLDLTEKYSLNLRHTIIMETGGMKGRRKEITRDELHKQLKKRLGVTVIHSEYGMTELLSQAYSKRNGVFNCPSWMKVLVRDINDPLQLLPANQTGALNIIDLANFNSCSFIATSDLGKVYYDGSFEVLGRMDNSDLRGCSLLAV